MALAVLLVVLKLILDNNSEELSSYLHTSQSNVIVINLLSKSVDNTIKSHVFFEDIVYTPLLLTVYSESPTVLYVFTTHPGLGCNINCFPKV